MNDFFRKVNNYLNLHYPKFILFSINIFLFLKKITPLSINLFDLKFIGKLFFTNFHINFSL